MPEWSIGADCKSAGLRPTKVRILLLPPFFRFPPGRGAAPKPKSPPSPGARRTRWFPARPLLVEFAPASRTREASGQSPLPTASELLRTDSTVWCGPYTNLTLTFKPECLSRCMSQPSSPPAPLEAMQHGCRQGGRWPRIAFCSGPPRGEPTPPSPLIWASLIAP